MKAIVTGSGGLIGSECVRLLCEEGWQVIGVDNDMRKCFFGPDGSTRPIIAELSNALSNSATSKPTSVIGRPSATYSIVSVPTSSSTLQPSLLTTRLPPFPTRTLISMLWDAQPARCRARFLPGIALLLHQHQQGIWRRPNLLPLIEQEKRYICGRPEWY